MKTGIPKESERCVMIMAPHTTNWDFVIGMGAFYDINIPAKIAMKKEWFRFPYNLVIKPMGGLPIDRSPKNPGEPRRSAVEGMAEIFKHYDRIAMTVTPEGSRSKMTEWKTGFWYTAKLAGVPICLGHLNYETKTVEISKVIFPSEIEKDMREIMDFYRDKKGKYPEKFSLDERYA